MSTRYGNERALHMVISSNRVHRDGNKFPRFPAIGARTPAIAGSRLPEPGLPESPARAAERAPPSVGPVRYGQGGTATRSRRRAAVSGRVVPPQAGQVQACGRAARPPKRPEAPPDASHPALPARPSDRHRKSPAPRGCRSTCRNGRRGCGPAGARRPAGQRGRRRRSLIREAAGPQARQSGRASAGASSQSGAGRPRSARKAGLNSFEA
jgi:hypothetical protein